MNPEAYLGRRVLIKIDRPAGSRHPQHGFLYPVNYGYLPGVLAPDGEDLDAYVLDITDPLEQFEGVCIAVIRRLDDQDDKLVVACEGTDLSNDEILRQTRFQEQFFHSRIIR